MYFEFNLDLVGVVAYLRDISHMYLGTCESTLSHTGSHRWFPEPGWCVYHKHCSCRYTAYQWDYLCYQGSSVSDCRTRLATGAMDLYLFLKTRRSFCCHYARL